jgi:hypothetical protein
LLVGHLVQFRTDLEIHCGNSRFTELNDSALAFL